MRSGCFDTGRIERVSSCSNASRTMATHLYDLGGVDSKIGGNTTNAGNDEESDRKECEKHCRSVQEMVWEEKGLQGE